ncbi:MAG: hypothetical protein DMF37_11195 [Verrucomicrobia bacterium]|nr:MAG: hypothetical protein DMF37_11195 [Verrucomicrobiota bacterium]
MWLRSGKIDTAAPDPPTFVFVVLDQRQRLRIVHDHKIVLEEITDAVLVNYLFEDFLLNT